MIHIKTFVFSPIQENTYVLYSDNKDCIIIDPGCYFDEEKNSLAQYIDNNQLKPRFLLNTHCHLDHVFGNKFVAEKYQLTPFIHAEEKIVFDYAPTAGLMYNLPFDHYEGPLQFLQEGSEINLGNSMLKTFFTPGHSPGSVSFYNESQSFIISGDVLFKNSIGRTDLPGGNIDVLLKSIKSKLQLLPKNTIVYSGHGDSTTIGEEESNNPFLIN